MFEKGLLAVFDGAQKIASQLVFHRARSARSQNQDASLRSPSVRGFDVLRLNRGACRHVVPFASAQIGSQQTMQTVSVAAARWAKAP